MTLIEIVSYVSLAAFAGAIIGFVFSCSYCNKKFILTVKRYEDHIKDLSENIAFWRSWCNKYKDLWKAAERTNTIIINDPDNFKNIKFGD